MGGRGALGGGPMGLLGSHGAFRDPWGSGGSVGLCGGRGALWELWQGLFQLCSQHLGPCPTQVVLTKICRMYGEWLKVQSLKHYIPRCESQLCLLLTAYLWATFTIRTEMGPALQGGMRRECSAGTSAL